MEATPGDGRCAARQRRQEVQEGRGKKGGRGRDVHRYGRENTRAKKEGKGGQGCGRQRRRKEGNGGAVEGEERRREQGDARAGKAAKRERGEERRGLPPPRDGWQGCVGALAVGAAAVQPVPYTPARAAAAARRREAVGGEPARQRRRTDPARHPRPLPATATATGVGHSGPGRPPWLSRYGAWAHGTRGPWAHETGHAAPNRHDSTAAAPRGARKAQGERGVDDGVGGGPPPSHP